MEEIEKTSTQDFFMQQFETAFQNDINKNEESYKYCGFMKNIDDLKLRMLYALSFINIEEKVAYKKQRNKFINAVIEMTQYADSWVDITETLKATTLLVDVEKCLLHEICSANMIINNPKEYGSIAFKEKLDKGIVRMKIILDSVENCKPVKRICNQYLLNIAHTLFSRCKKRENVGRHVGTGKRTFKYNGKTYTTIQSCADDYNISKQAMHKRLKKAGII